jgi:hypothetical protein
VPRLHRSTFVSLAAAVVLAALAAPLHAGPLAARAAAIDSPRRGDVVTLTGPLLLGRGEILPAAGTRVYALLADGVPCGLLVDGRARFRYRVEDRFSMPVAERNFTRSSSLEPRRVGAALSVEEQLTGAVVWGWGMTPPPAPDAAPSSMAALPRWAAEQLADRRFSPASHDLLEAEANGDLGLRYAVLGGEDDLLLLHVDPVAGDEDLYSLVRSRDPGSTFHEGVGAVQLASQPMGHAWWVRQPSALVAEHEALRVENPAGDDLRFTSRSRLRARRGGVALWQAELVDRVFDAGGRVRRLAVQSVRVDGRQADFLHKNGQLLVSLGRALATGDAVEVEVAYGGDLAVRPGGNSYWVLGTWPWYPRRQLDGELATMEIEVDVPAALMPFASGAEVSRDSAPGRRRLVTRLDKPMQFAVVTAGKYAVVEETRDGVTCRVATYALLKERAARELIEKFFSGRQMLEQLFGEPYPFHNFSIVELNEWGFGQAPPGIMFFTKEFFTAPVEGRTRVFFDNLDARYLHEIAHGWFGNVAKMDAPEESWLAESFADYTAALALWRLRGGDRGAYALDEIVKGWYRGASEIAPGASLYLSTRLAFNDERSVVDFFRLRYAKGPLVVHALRLELQRQKGSVEEGDRHFIALLRSFLQRTRYTWGTTAELVRTLDELTGGDWQPWFERYVYGTETPQVPLAGSPAQGGSTGSTRPHRIADGAHAAPYVGRQTSPACRRDARSVLVKSGSAGVLAGVYCLRAHVPLAGAGRRRGGGRG